MLPANDLQALDNTQDRLVIAAGAEWFKLPGQPMVVLETRIPLRQLNNGLSVGGYHCGLPVRAGMHVATGVALTAPLFKGEPWKGERDGSITCDSDQSPCEFVSPILQGEDGVEHLIKFVEWLNAIIYEMAVRSMLFGRFAVRIEDGNLVVDPTQEVPKGTFTPIGAPVA